MKKKNQKTNIWLQDKDSIIFHKTKV